MAFPKADIAEIVTPSQQAAPRNWAKVSTVIRVRVPLDLHTVARSGSGAFAMATPLRVRELVALAVREASGSRAPAEKLARNLRSTFHGISSGRFRVDIDGRAFDDMDGTVLCGPTADVRFFLARAAQRRSSEMPASER